MLEGQLDKLKDVIEGDSNMTRTQSPVIHKANSSLIYSIRAQN